MVNDWCELTLEESMDAIIDYRGKTPKKTDSGIPLITAKIIKNGRIETVNEFISEDDYDTWMRRGIPNEGDVVMTTEAPLGEIAQLDGRKIALAQRVITLRGKKEVLDNTFLKYLMISEYVQHQLDGRGTGTTVKGIKQSELRKVMLKFPSFIEQKVIAHILGSLDEKIELNRQMNETLEAMAQALFKSWFVDFDPVIDNALAAGNAIPDEFIERAELRKGIEKKENSDIQNLFPDEFEFTEEMGWIPKGWSITSLENVCSKITDGSHSSPKSVDVGYPMASVKDMHNWGFDLSTCRKISEEDYHELRRNNCNPLKNDVLIAKDGSYLKHIFVVEEDLDLVILSSIAMLRPNKNINPHFLSLTLKRKDVLRMMENYVSGAVLQRIVLRDFRKFLIVNPPIEIQTYWFKLVEGMFEASWNNIHTNSSLAKFRDTLLPKLMSGELRLEGIPND